MKKLILLTILCISLIGNIYANDTTKVELTKETIYKDVKGAISQLADALKVGAEHVYEILVKQQIVDSITILIVYIVFGISGCLFINQGNKLEKLQKNDYKSSRNDIIGWFYVPGVIMLICLLICFFFTITDVVTGFINPEYGAIKEIMNMIR